MKTAIHIPFSSGASRATREQLQALGFTESEIKNGKRFEIKSVGPWQITKSIRGIVRKGDDFYPVRTMGGVSQPGTWSEGWLSLNGKKKNAFTSSVIFELEDGHLTECAVLVVR